MPLKTTIKPRSNVDIPSLYVHIPFCEHLCAYCDFAKVFYKQSWSESYLASLFKELEDKHPTKFQTIYVGGGTPSVLPLSQLTKLLSVLSPFLVKGGEFTVEGNPESLTKDKLLLMHKYGVNRLSIGVQSSSPRLLSLMERKHTFLDAVRVVKEAKEVGFPSINCDLIYGLPSETLEEAKQDAEAFISLGTDHLSAYCLSVNPGTSFYDAGYREMDEDEAADMYEAILSSFRKAGFDRYEVSNFAKDGHMCRHNLTYWRDEQYMAIGLGASGYEGEFRYKNTRSLKKYLAGQYEEEREKVTLKDDLEYFFLTNLRLEKGFLLSDFRARFGFSFLEKYGVEVDSLKKEGLLEVTSNSVFATDKGILLLDKILLSLY
jgi:oxygen-independent coproporphyrinogen-3 oxidase